MDAQRLPPLNDPVRLEEHNPDWAEQFALEKTRILSALGEAGRGGVVWAVHHIGSTAIPRIQAKPVIDILLLVHPAPLTAHHIAALNELGYEYRGEAGVPGRQFFRTQPRTRHLHVFDLDAPEVHRHLLFRDYLTSHPLEALRYETLKLELAERFEHDREAYTDGKDGLIRQQLERAERWWYTEVAFQPLEAITDLFQAAAFDWFVSSGWALDAWLGRVQRYHHDVDLLVWRDQQAALHEYLTARGWQLNVVQNGLYQDWRPQQWLALPSFQIHAYKGNIMLDLMLAERDGPDWQYRRDLSVTRDIRQAVLETPLGWRVLAPEIVLLFKSSSAGGQARPKDQLDFERIAGLLPSEARAWLRAALEKTTPGHAWLEQLS